jgi:hypothetical protein
VYGACRSWRLGLREVDEGVEEVTAVPFHGSGEVEVGHGDGGAG